MKPTILLFVSCYLPGYKGGGPIKSVSNLVDHLSDQYQFKIVTRDRDVGDISPYTSVRVNSWNAVRNADVFYASTDRLSLTGIASLIRETPHDLLYVNSFFGPIFSIRPMLARRLFGLKKTAIIAPRGEFSQGALHIKWWKKKPYIKLSKLFGLYRNVIWHASTDFEKADIRKIFPHAKLKVASNISVAPRMANEIESDRVFTARGRDTDRPLKICFLSRISPKKNLHFALEVLAKTSVAIDFSIYGPKESSAYWIACEALIRKLPSHVKATYFGSVSADDVRSVIAEHDIFFLPTFGENFGHVLLESLSVGVPLLISDQTPWRGLKKDNIGWDISLNDFECFVDVLNRAATIPTNDYFEIRRSCLKFAIANAENRTVLQMNRSLFSDALIGV